MDPKGTGRPPRGRARVRCRLLGFVVSIGIALTHPGSAGASADRAEGSWESWTVDWRGEAHEVRIYRPAGFPSHRPYPVVYLLSGWAMGLGMWERLDLEQAADAAQVLLVALQGEDGGIPSYYSIYAGLPWPGGSAWRVSFYDWFFQGVLPWVEGRYPVRRDPGGRALIGFSMGGKGAFSLAAHRPDQFAAAVSIGGVLDLSLHDSPALRAVYGPPGADPLRAAADNPVELAPNLKGLTLMLFHGAADPEVSLIQSRRMHEALQALGYPHHWEETPGLGHSISAAQIARIFRALEEAFRSPRRPPDRWSYRFVMDRARTVYGMTVMKTDPATWTELREVRTGGLEVRSGDPVVLITPPWYPAGASLSIRIQDARSGVVEAERPAIARGGRLRLELPAGQWRIAITGLAPAPLRRKPLCPEADLVCYRFS